MSAIVGRAVGMRICDSCVGASCPDLCREKAQKGAPSPPWLSAVRPAPFRIVIKATLFRQLSQGFLSLPRGSKRSISRRGGRFTVGCKGLICIYERI